MGTHVISQSFLDSDSLLASLVPCVEKLLALKSGRRSCRVGVWYKELLLAHPGLGHGIGLLVV